MRKSLLALAATGLAFALTACGSPSSGNNTPAGSSDSAKASGTLTLWADETRIEGFNAIGEAFQKATGVKLEVVQKPTDDVRTDFIAQAPSGAGPDLIVGPNDWVGGLVKNGVVAPVELGDKTSGLSDVAKKAFTSGGSLYGVPYAVENIALVRNNALAKETPATFDELVAQGKQLTPEHPVLIQQGDKGDAYPLYPVQSSFGASLFKTEGANDLGMKGEAGEKFAEYIKKLTGEGVLSESIGGDQAKQAFLDGKSPYIITGPWWTGEFTKAGLDVSVVPVPSAGGQPAAPFVGVQGVYLSSQSKNTLLAGQFLDYMAGDEAQKILQEKGGRLPALKSAAASVTDPILKGFEQAAADGEPLPTLTSMDAVWNYWGAAELSIVNGNDPTSTWQQMITNVEEAIAKG